MALQKLPLSFSTEDGYSFTNNKDFLNQTEGHGIKCTFCNSKIFYGYTNWKAHCKSKRHQERTANVKELNPLEKEIIILKAEIKKQKIIAVQESNKCQILRESLLSVKKDLKILKTEIKKKFKLK